VASDWPNVGASQTHWDFDLVGRSTVTADAQQRDISLASSFLPSSICSYIELSIQKSVISPLAIQPSEMKQVALLASSLRSWKLRKEC